jgi:homoprotocatechuate degradation regulator HpaR
LKNRITYRNLPQLFLKARECLLLHFRPILNHYGLTEQQWRILRVLDERGQCEPWEICEMCQISSSSMAGVLARMEETGLVQRSRVSGDQRRVLVELGKRGDRLIDEIAPLIASLYENIERAYGKRLFNDLFRSLENFIEAADKPVPTVELPVAASSAASRKPAKKATIRGKPKASEAPKRPGKKRT